MFRSTLIALKAMFRKNPGGRRNHGGSSGRRRLAPPLVVEALEDRLCLTGSWTTEAPMPTARIGPVAGVINGVLYAVGGNNPTTFLATNEAFFSGDVWTGLGPDNNWSDPANWQGAIAPTPGDALLFPSGASQLANNDDFPDGTSFSSIQFTGAGYDISGNDITLTSGMSSNVGRGGDDAVNNNLILPADATFNFLSSSNSQLTLSGDISGSGGIKMNGNGPGPISHLILGGTDTYAGATRVNQGVLVVAGSMDASSDITAGNGARFFVSGTLTVEANITMNGLIIADAPQGTVDDFGSITVTGTFLDQSFGNGSTAGVQVEPGASFLVQGFFMNVSDFIGSLDDFGLVTVTGQFRDVASIGGSLASVQIEQGAALDIQGTVTVGHPSGGVGLSGTLDDFGSITVKPGGTLLTTGSGNGTLAGLQVEPGALLASQGTVQVAGSTRPSDTGVMVVNGFMTGSLTVAAGGFLEGAGSVGNVTAVNGGTIVPGSIGSSGILYAQSLNLSNGGVLYIQVSGYQNEGTDFSKLVTGNLVLGGTAKLTLDLSGLTDTGTIQGIVTDGGQTGAFSQVQVLNNPFGFGDTVIYKSDGIDVTFF